MDGTTTANNYNYFMRQTLSQAHLLQTCFFFRQISYRNPFDDLHP